MSMMRFVNVCMYVNMYVGMNVCVYVYMYVDVGVCENVDACVYADADVNVSVDALG